MEGQVQVIHGLTPTLFKRQLYIQPEPNFVKTYTCSNVKRGILVFFSSKLIVHNFLLYIFPVFL